MSRSEYVLHTDQLNSHVSFLLNTGNYGSVLNLLQELKNAATSIMAHKRPQIHLDQIPNYPNTNIPEWMKLDYDIGSTKGVYNEAKWSLIYRSLLPTKLTNFTKGSLEIVYEIYINMLQSARPLYDYYSNDATIQTFDDCIISDKNVTKELKTSFRLLQSKKFCYSRFDLLKALTLNYNKLSNKGKSNLWSVLLLKVPSYVTEQDNLFPRFDDIHAMFNVCQPIYALAKELDPSIAYPVYDKTITIKEALDSFIAAEEIPMKRLFNKITIDKHNLSNQTLAFIRERSFNLSESLSTDNFAMLFDIVLDYFKELDCVEIAKKLLARKGHAGEIYFKDCIIMEFITRNIDCFDCLNTCGIPMSSMLDIFSALCDKLQKNKQIATNYAFKSKIHRFLLNLPIPRTPYEKYVINIAYITFA